MTEELRFKDRLASDKLKYTPERKLIFAEVMQTEEAFGAEELAARLKLRSSRVSRATVYRTLDLLLKMGLVSRVCRGDKPALYHKPTANREAGHMVCLSCGRVDPFTLDEFDRQIERQSGWRGFKVTGHCLQISGYCAACQKERL